MDTKIHREEVFGENRHELFVKRLSNDLIELEKLNFDGKSVKRIIGTFPYVKVYKNTPTWIYPILKLPKSLKWTNGIKFSQKGYPTITLLETEDNLYIKGIEIPGTHIKDSKLSYIKNWKSVNPIEVATYFGLYNTNILQFYKDHGIYIGLNVPILREIHFLENFQEIY